MRSEDDHLLTYGLRNTQPRKRIIKAFLNSQTALSQSELERHFGSEIDRVTIYRTLKSFLEAGVLHRIPDADQTALYALCQTDECQPETHHAHNHLHFKCTNCGETECLHNIRVPQLDIPAGYKIKELTLLAEGICPRCEPTANHL